MENVAEKETMGIVGIVTVRSYPAGTVDRMRELHAAGRHDEAQKIFYGGKLESRSKNTVVDSANCGIDILRQWFVSGLVSSFAYPLGPQWGEIGTGSTTPTTSDVALTTPVARASISNAVNNGAGSDAVLQFYFTDASLANGTYHEFGTFVGGPTDTSLGSGQMVNHVLFGSAYTKSSGNDTTCEVDITIANI
jgi:hypothetical protein